MKSSSGGGHAGQRRPAPEDRREGEGEEEQEEDNVAHRGKRRKTGGQHQGAAGVVGAPVPHGGDAEAVQQLVRSHYNARPNTSVEDRVRSPIYHLRNFNNWIKSALIADFTSPRATVLDLCAGKGGDLPKWCKANILYWVAAGGESHKREVRRQSD